MKRYFYSSHRYPTRIHFWMKTKLRSFQFPGYSARSCISYQRKITDSWHLNIGKNNFSKGIWYSFTSKISMNKHIIENEKVVVQNSTKKMEEIRQFARFLRSTVSATRPFGRSAENATKKNSGKRPFRKINHSPTSTLRRYAISLIRSGIPKYYNFLEVTNMSSRPGSTLLTPTPNFN